MLLDLRSVLGPLHGIARYSLELARRLPVLAPGWNFVGLTDPEGIPSDLGDLAPRIPLVKAPARFLSMLEQPALLAVLVSDDHQQVGWVHVQHREDLAATQGLDPPSDQLVDAFLRGMDGHWSPFRATASVCPMIVRA